jgi:hypothetical protein
MRAVTQLANASVALTRSVLESTGVAAAPAIAGARSQLDLTAIVCNAIAIRKPLRAREDHASSCFTRGARVVRATGVTATATVLQIGR